MIYIHTGQPGAGKTFYTLHHVRERAKKENRAVYYHGIELLKPEAFEGWQKLETPEKWHELPDGAIIVHDECQTLYRPRGTGAQVPEHVAKLETHRHKGFDLYFITQHPMLIDSNVRRLAGEHKHIVRSFGAEFAIVHKWQQVKEQCDKSRADSLQEQFRYPAELKGAYQSATIHTHKRKLPARLLLLPLIPLLIGACIWGFMQWFGGIKEAAPETSPASTGAPGQHQLTAPRAIKTKSQYLDERMPRIEGLAHTAPVFDQVTEPSRAPYPAACVEMSGTCRCYTDQGTRLDTPGGICRQIVANGYFVEWETDRKESGRRDERRVSDGRPADRITVEPDRKGGSIGAGSYAGVPPLSPN